MPTLRMALEDFLMWCPVYALCIKQNTNSTSGFRKIPRYINLQTVNMEDTYEQSAKIQPEISFQ